MEEHWATISSLLGLASSCTNILVIKESPRRAYESAELAWLAYQSSPFPFLAYLDRMVNMKEFID